MSVRIKTAMSFKEEERVQKIQKDEITALKKFYNVCKKYNIKFFLIGGNLLGAIRHKGFIPWDDDVDICMDKENYNLLLEKRECFEEEDIFFRKFEQGATFGQLLFKVNYLNNKINFDIFVLRGISKKNINKWIQLALSRLFVLFEYIQVTNFTKKKKSLFKNIFFSVMEKIQELFKKINLSQKTYGIYTKIYNLFMNQYQDFLFLGLRMKFLVLSKEDVYPLKKVPYEGLSLPILNNYEKYLLNQYGDYMKLPSIDKRKPHH